MSAATMVSSLAKDMDVYARWRPLTEKDSDAGAISYKTVEMPGSLAAITATPEADAVKVRPWGTFPVTPWESAPAFKTVFGPETNNSEIYKLVVAPAIPKVMEGANCSFFAYGHSGSGKTHTMVGYDQDNEESLGLSLAAARDLFKLIDEANKNNPSCPLGVGLSVFELRSKNAIDLLNNCAKCDIREGADGRIHIRGQPEILDSGEVKVNFIVKHPCWTFDVLKHELNKAISLRSVGASEVHDQSSRSHAIIEFEIISKELLDARNAVIEAKAKEVPVGKESDDYHYLLTEIRRREKGLSGTNTVDKRITEETTAQELQRKIDQALRLRRKLQSQVSAAEEHVLSVLKSATSSNLGTKLVFVDLAGAEYHKHKAESADAAEQSWQERHEGCQINSDVMALKEVMRAWAKDLPRIPFRASPLTMILREYFAGPKKGVSAVIVTLSPAKQRYTATLDSLRYGSLVGAPGA